MQAFAKTARFLYKSTTRFKKTENVVIMGIESSCDDTGCALIDNHGNILGEFLHSQHLVHLNNGGIIPTIAQDLHRKHIENVVDSAVRAANLTFNDITAIATTVKPGLPMSLLIGMKYGTYLCKKHNKPFIPIHHMEAHALTARMCHKVDFPFLVLLISGGHCLLAIAQNVDKFLLLGHSFDDAPGEAFDKGARRLKLKNLQEYAQLNGGQAIELAARKAENPERFPFTTPLLHLKDCNFSMTGIKAQLLRHILKEEQLHDVPPDGVIPTYADLCAGYLTVITRHLCHRVQRAAEFARRQQLIPAEKQVLVVSGGVACNKFIADTLKVVCDEIGYEIVVPAPKLCTDNGIMIAWNGLEKYRINSGVTTDFSGIEVEKSCPLGSDISEEVAKAQISCKWVKLKPEQIKTNLLK